MPTIWLLAEFFLIAFIAWQDWKDRHVSISIVFIILVSLTLKQSDPFHSLAMFLLLGAYRYFRKNSIQGIDIILFSLGAGCFPFFLLPVYCIITAVCIVLLYKALKTQQLPFVTAWFAGFWGTYFVKNCISC